MFGSSVEEKKDYIAQIAARVFYTKGFKESSLADISAKGKLSKAGIYYYFKSKEDILVYILLKVTNEGIQTLNESLSKCDTQQLDPEETFKELIRTYANYLLNNKRVELLVLRERHQLSGKHRKSVLIKEREIFNLLKYRLARIPNLNTGLSLHLIVFQIISMLHWMGYWFNEKGEITRTEAVEQSISLIFNGIR